MIEDIPQWLDDNHVQVLNLCDELPPDSARLLREFVANTGWLIDAYREETAGALDLQSDYRHMLDTLRAFKKLLKV